MSERTNAAPTLEAVARLAGVSRATVSRVVNQSPRVTAEVITRVNAAIGELGYVPNRAARSLVSRRTQAIGILVPEEAAKIFDEPYFASIIQGAAQYLGDTEYTLSLLFASANSVEKTRRYLLGGNVDGVIVISHHRGDRASAQLSASLPVVYGGRPLIDGQDADSFYVDADNVAGARVATDHFVSTGRTRIATIAGPADMTAGLDRLAGWRDALEEAGLDSSLVEHGTFSPESGAQAMRHLLMREPKLDAVFAANDHMAAGAYSVLAEAGRRIPDDVAVIGFDDGKIAPTQVPPLASVAQPATRMGAEMARLVIRLIEGADDVPRVTMMPTSLVLRASAG